MFEKAGSSGVFFRDGDGFSELTELPGNGSINDINQSLGYHPDQVFGYFDTKRKEAGIIQVSLEIFSRNIVFVLTEKSVTRLRPELVEEYLGSFRFEEVYPSYVAEGFLKEGIANKSLSFDYLSRVLHIKDGDKDGIIYVESLELYLYFIDGWLVDFQASDGLNEWAKLWKQRNREWLLDYYRFAAFYWPGEPGRARAEINAQADAWANRTQRITSSSRFIQAIRASSTSSCCEYVITRGRCLLTSFQRSTMAAMYRLARIPTGSDALNTGSMPPAT